MIAGQKSKNAYQSNIHTYLERRERLKERYGVGSTDYIKRSKKLQRKLSIWRKAIKRIEARELRLLAIDRQLKEFMGITVRNSVAFITSDFILARSIFSKHCMENHLNGKWVADYCGYRYKDAPGRLRMQFTRSFATKPQNKELWLRWKEFINRDEIKIAA